MQLNRAQGKNSLSKKLIFEVIKKQMKSMIPFKLNHFFDKHFLLE